MRLALLLAILATAGAAQAQPRAAAATREKLAVLVLGTTEADAVLADNVTEVLIGFVARRGGAEIAGKEEFRARVGVQDESRAHACIADVTCLGRAAVSLGVRRIVAGTVATRKNQFLFNLNLIDVAAGKVDSRVFRLVEGGVEALVEAVRNGADELFTPKPDPGRIKVTTAPQGMRVLIDNAVVGVTPLISGTLLPGRHAVRVEAARRFPWSSTVEVLPGQDLGINLTAGNLPERKAWPSYAAYGAGGAALLSLGTGAFFGLVSQLSLAGQTRAAQQDDFEQKQRLATTANVLFVGSAVCAAVSAFLFYKYSDHIFGRD